MIKILSAMILIVIFIGCGGLVTVNIAQRATLENGDGSKDNYDESSRHTKESSATLLKPIKGD